MIPQRIGEDTTCEGLAAAWGISPELAVRLLLLARSLQTPLLIISGFRSPEQQESAGDMAAAEGRSTHRTCPATGADLRLPLIEVEKTLGGVLGSTLALAQVFVFGHLVETAGLRWGGGSRRIAGIPVDWNHVDLGPRVS